MDLQTRKISFVQEFLKLQNEEIISLFENLLRKERKKISSKKLEPMTLEEFNKRIDLSLEDSEKGRLTESSELLSEIEKWS
jgi:rRNA pseudouridine-1189 N-methylase Emg1 (Nep1/Mra1 family)